MKHIKTFESFLSESKINEADVWDKIRNYFPNPANPEDYITTKIMSLGKKTPFTVVIDDMIANWEEPTEEEGFKEIWYT